MLEPFCAKNQLNEFCLHFLTVASRGSCSFFLQYWLGPRLTLESPVPIAQSAAASASVSSVLVVANEQNLSPVAPVNAHFNLLANVMLFREERLWAVPRNSSYFCNSCTAHTGCALSFIQSEHRCKSAYNF